MVFDYHDVTCGRQIFDYAHGQLKLCWDIIGAPSGVVICMQTLSNGKGAKYGMILFNNILRQDVEYTSPFLMTFLGEHMGAQSGHFEFAKMFTSGFSRLVDCGQIQFGWVQVILKVSLKEQN